MGRRACAAIGEKSHGLGDKMQLAILLGVLTIALHFGMNTAAGSYGPDVGRRWLETGDNYTVDCLKNWVSGGDISRCNMVDPKRDTKLDAASYAWPVLFPYDLLFMLALGGFLGWGSFTCAQSIEVLRNVALLFAIFPALYFLADLLEDSLLARLLRNPDSITPDAVDFAKKVTAAKICTVKIAMAQTFLVAAASLVPAWQAQPQ
jgi:hypothetical protein